MGNQAAVGDPADPQDLRAQNNSKVLYWVAFHLAVFWSFWTADIQGIDVTLGEVFTQLTTEGSVFMVLGPILGLALNTFLSEKEKAHVAFMMRQHPLPGTRWMDLITKDPTIDEARLLKKLGEKSSIPPEMDPDAQNDYWYAIYKANRDNEMVRGAQARWLLTRDLACQSFLFFCFSAFFIVGSAFFGVGWAVTGLYAVVAGLVYLWIGRSARNNGTAFVLRVLKEAA